MRYFSLIIFLPFVLFFAQLTDPPDAPLRPVAEFERSQGVLIAYPFGIPVSFIAQLSELGKVYCLVDASFAGSATAEMNSGGVNGDNVELITGPVDTYWTQDYGPYYVVDANHDMVIVDYDYNRPRPFDNQAPYKMSQHFDVPYFDSDVVHNGGNLMFDGYNTAASSTLVYTENWGIDVDQRMADYFGALHHMTVDDPTVNFHQHINCWAKFLSPEKLMICEVPPSHSQYDEIEEVVTFYEGQLNCFGEPYKIYRVYTPNTEPYCNSFIYNDNVFIPTGFGQWDDDAITTFEAALPEYNVYGIIANPWYQWWPEDALHCRILAIPDMEMLQILHNPLDEMEFPMESYPVIAVLDPLSEMGLIADSLKVYWKNDLMEDYTSIMLELNDGENEYFAGIPPQPIDTNVRYYIAAADSSGRVERLPIAGYYEFFTYGGYPLQMGDVNQDEQLNILDLLVIVNHILNISPLDGYSLYLADANQDGEINVFDIIILLNAIVNG